MDRQTASPMDQGFVVTAVQQIQSSFTNSHNSKQFERAQDSFEKDVDKLEQIMDDLDEAIQGEIDFEKIKK